MKLWVAIILQFLLFNSFSSISQQQNYAFKNIDINQGLSQNSVVDIAEDEKGFIWFATQDGLNRYDGRNFLVFPKSFDDITTTDNVRLGKLVADGHQMWLIKKGGKVEILDLFTHNFSAVEHLAREAEPLPPAASILIDHKKGTWIGLIDDGLIHIDSEEKIQKYSENAISGKEIISNRIRSVFEDSTNNIWVLTASGITRLSEGNTAEDHLETINTHVMTETPDSSLWVGTLGNGIYIREHPSSSFMKFTGFGEEKIPNNLVVEAIHADEQERIWVGTYGNGLYVIDIPGSRIVHLMPDRQDPHSLNFQDILSIKEDNNGGIWIGSDGGGISYFNRQFNKFNTIAIHNVEDHISIEQIRAIETDSVGVVWLGTSGQGLTSFDPAQNKFKTKHLTPFKPGISNYDRIVALKIGPQGDLWIGTQGNGLLILDTATGEIKKWLTTDASREQDRIPDNTIWAFLPQGDQMWVATRNEGLVLLDPEEGVMEHYKLPPEEKGGVEGRNVQSLIRINKSTLAVGFESRGVHLLDVNTGRFNAVSTPGLENIFFTETDIKSLYHQKDWLWIGTGGKGIVVTNLKTKKTYLLNDTNWLPNNMVYGFLEEEKNVLWASSNKGLFRLRFSLENNNISIKGISPFTVNDGLQSNEFNTGAYHRAKDGRLFFGGISGLTYFDPQELSHGREELEVVLTEAMVGNSPIKRDTSITYLNKLNLPHWQNSLSFNYTALDYISPENISFQYRLEGYDEEWINAGTRNYTAYTNLPPADYIFKVKISDQISKQAPPASLYISIAVPFWKQWWFLLLVGLFTIAFIYGMHRYRIYQVIQVQKVKNNISADLHDDLGSRLTNIQFLTALSKKKVTPGTQDIKYLEGIEEEVEASAKALDEIVWNIKMKDEKLEEILAKMRKYAGEMLQDCCEYDFEIKGKFTKRKMSMQKRRELFLVFKELLNNIRKHAAATRVKIKISIEEEMFLLRIRDNGKGFEPKQKTNRNGLKNIRDRVDKWNGGFKIESEKNKGTFVAIKIPFDRWFTDFYNV